MAVRKLEIATLYDPLPQQKKFHTSTAKYRLLGGAAGGGKRLCLSTKVFTDSGWKKAGEITTEDRLLAPDGTYTNIVGIYYGYDKPTYKVTFYDDRWVNVDGEHNWYVKGDKHGGRDGWKVRTTKEILDIKEKQVIPLCDAAPGKKWNGPDPYILGLLLGDGTLTGHYTTVYTVEKEIINYLEKHGWHIYKYEAQNTTMCQFFKEDFRGVLGRVSGVDKEVPEELLMADQESRLAVLQGLMDTDGHHDKPPKGGCGFTNKSKQLCKDVVYLVRSLGGKAKLHKVERGERMCKGYKTDGKYYKVNVSHLGKFNPFRLTRKKKLVNPNQGNNTLGIKSIEKVKNSDGVCFEVDHPSHLYVVQDFIVTHNTIAIIWEAILRSIKYDFPITGAIFRKSYPELESTIIRTMRTAIPNWFYKYNQSQHIMTLANGSIIEFCYAESDNDVYRYQSREWEWLGVDELTHFSQYQWTYLMSRVRTSKPVNTKFFAATNPGNIGHEWVKQRWVTKTCADENYDPKDYDFVPAGVMENPYILNNNPDYIENLKMLPEKERKALLEGSWDVFEGQFFNEWSPVKHISEVFDVPENWQLVMGWDDGTREPRSVHVYAIDNDRRIWVIWEYYKAGENLREAATNVREKLQEAGLWDRIYKCVVDPSMRREDSQTGTTSTDVLDSMGFGFKIGAVELGNNDRVEGWRIVKSYLDFKPYEEPMLKIFKNCDNMIRTLPQLVYYTPKSGGTSKKEDLDTTQEDHAADDLRYTLMSLDRLPSRFESNSSIKVVRRRYAPKSSIT